MAHALETVNGKTNMFYVGATPWHGLGTKLDAPPTVEAAMAAAGLDWKVNLVQLQTPDGVPVDRFACVRSSDSKVLGTVGGGYRPLQNDEAFQFFQPFLDAKVANLETAGSLKGGSRVWALAKIDRPDSVIVAKADDRVSKYLLLANGHDGSLAVRVGLTPIRVVCQNTLSAAIAGGSATIKIRHTTRVKDIVDEVQHTIERVDNDFEKAAEVFRALAKVRIKSAGQVKAYVDAVFPSRAVKAEAIETDGAEDFASLLSRPAKLSHNKADTDKSSMFEAVERILETGGRHGDLSMPGIKGTAWAAYNAVTEFLTWERGRNDDNRLNANWFMGGPAERALPSAIDEFLRS